MSGRKLKYRARPQRVEIVAHRALYSLSNINEASSPLLDNECHALHSEMQSKSMAAVWHAQTLAKRLAQRHAASQNRRGPRRHSVPVVGVPLKVCSYEDSELDAYILRRRFRMAQRGQRGPRAHAKHISTKLTPDVKGPEACVHVHTLRVACCLTPHSEKGWYGVSSPDTHTAQLGHGLLQFDQALCSEHFDPASMFFESFDENDTEGPIQEHEDSETSGVGEVGEVSEVGEESEEHEEQEQKTVQPREGNDHMWEQSQNNDKAAGRHPMHEVYDSDVGESDESGECSRSDKSYVDAPWESCNHCVNPHKRFECLDWAISVATESDRVEQSLRFLLNPRQ